MRASEVGGVGASPSQDVAHGRADIVGTDRFTLRALLRAAQGSEPLPVGRAQAADLLAVFSFGAGTGRRVSLTNRQLAKACDRWPGLPVLAQAEIAQTLARRGRAVVDVDDDARRHQAIATPDVDLVATAAAMAQLVRGAGFSRVGVVAHPAHVGRCAALLARHGVEPIIADLGNVRIDFDTSSTQWWTRTQRAWSLRETAVLVHHRLLRRI